MNEGDDPPAFDRGLPQARFVKRFWLDALEHEMFEQARAKLAAELGREVTDDELLRESVRLLLSSEADGSVPGRKRVDSSLFRVLVQPSDTSGAGQHAARTEHEATLHVAGHEPVVLERDGEPVGGRSGESGAGDEAREGGRSRLESGEYESGQHDESHDPHPPRAGEDSPQRDVHQFTPAAVAICEISGGGPPARGYHESNTPYATMRSAEE